jgi:tRNA pseudouridine55 synthase
MTDTAKTDFPHTHARDAKAGGYTSQSNRPKKRDVNGWLVLDKPLGMTSTHAVAVAKRIFNAKKAGHAGTLDPLASGLLPIAFGEATKTVPFVMDGEKAYRFTVRWGIETSTDDAESEAVATSDKRPSVSEIEAILPQFMGEIMQMPPQFSALKIDGERAYDLARQGETVKLEPRPVEIHSLKLVSHDTDTAVFEAECGKGTYVRALARDFGRLLGCYGHVIFLRRTRVGPFLEENSVSPDDLTPPEGDHSFSPDAYLLTVEAGLMELPSITISGHDAARLQRGLSIILRGRDAPVIDGSLYATCQGKLIAFGEIIEGAFVPKRVFNFG